MNEEILQIRREMDELKAWKSLLESSSTIPLSIDQAFRSRFGRVLYGLKTHNFGSLASLASSTTTLTVVGAELNDPVVLGLSVEVISTDDVRYDAWVSDKDTVSIRAFNAGTSANDPDSGVFKVAVLKQ